MQQGLDSVWFEEGGEKRAAENLQEWQVGA